MQNIKNIIFDLGGILLNIDFSKTEAALTRLGVTKFNDLYNQHQASELFNLLETGKISPGEFHQLFIQETGVMLSYEQLASAWNALILDFPPERLSWLENIGKKYAIFLFSNTNRIHYDFYTTEFKRIHSGKEFNGYFKKAYYSHEMGLRKPYPESFLYIINEQKLKPEETLFIDDTLKNIEGAKVIGLQTIFIEHPKTVLDLAL